MSVASYNAHPTLRGNVPLYRYAFHDIDMPEHGTETVV